MGSDLGVDPNGYWHEELTTFCCADPERINLWLTMLLIQMRGVHQHSLLTVLFNSSYGCNFLTSVFKFANTIGFHHQQLLPMDCVCLSARTFVCVRARVSN